MLGPADFGIAEHINIKGPHVRGSILITAISFSNALGLGTSAGLNITRNYQSSFAVQLETVKINGMCQLSGNVTLLRDDDN